MQFTTRRLWLWRPNGPTLLQLTLPKYIGGCTRRSFSMEGTYSTRMRLEIWAFNITREDGRNRKQVVTGSRNSSVLSNLELRRRMSKKNEATKGPGGAGE